MDAYLMIGAGELNNAECTVIARKGIELSHDFVALKRVEVVRAHWPDFADTTGSEAVVPAKRLTSTAILRINLCTFVTGAPGAGKTTLMRRLSQRLATMSIGQLPILIYLADLKGVTDYDVVAYALRQLNSQGYRVSEERLRAELNDGNYRAFFDGLDEAGTNADYLLTCIRTFSETFPKCPVVITSRETLREKVWKDALHIRLAPLDDDQLTLFVTNWFTSEPSKCERMHGWLSLNPKMRETARTPIIAALLCSLMHADADMPSTEVELYEQRFELLLGRWEQAKGIQPLPPDLRRTYWHFMMNLAAEIHTREVRAISYGEAVSCASVYFSKTFHGIPEALVKDCIHRGLLEAEGVGGVSFGHLTYQEFAVARWLAHHNRTAFIIGHLSNRWWDKAIELYAAMKGDISALLEEGPRDEHGLARLYELVKLAPPNAAK